MDDGVGLLSPHLDGRRLAGVFVFCVLDLRFVLTWMVVGGSAALGSCSLGKAKQVAREGVKQREEPGILMFV
jgi:hypothetical protein